MRGRLCLIGAGLLVLAGCAEEVDAPQPVGPAPKVVRLPASAAGGACQLLEYPAVEEAIGTRFEVAAASRHGKTDTCVLRGEAEARPELALSVTPTTADAAIFADEVVPSGGKTVKGLGKAAYRSTTAPAKSAGSAIEVGWLTGNGRLVSLRFTFPAGQEQAEADALAPKMINLAKKIDTSSR
ncbi:hypothetical protein O7626_07630 [Micromonospora sp. WMMD1102]|uniref:hypothetical protein n=1 Tax=Micromonospora sp. WMMD1102 TaxID=3016105 RepID=UPI0024150DC8|nr:hypothetical protein [Micromonospora sp. WMMD1102]MDG4785798.1 hypothetical protein [Micromonospora sp. WMMD1102]